MTEVTSKHIGWVSAILTGVAIILAAPLVWWWGTPTTAYLRPISLTYIETGDQDCGTLPSPTGWCARFVRDTPRGEVFATWSTEVATLIEPISECHASGGPTPYQNVPGGVVYYAVNPRLVPCLASGQELRVTHQHSVIFGPFQLRPSTLIEIIEEQGR